LWAVQSVEAAIALRDTEPTRAGKGGPTIGNLKVAQVQNKWFRSFASQADREREETFCNHYRNIGIQAVAAAKCLRNQQSPTAGTDRSITANTAKKSG
jgi:hypothetical protein